MQSPNPNQGNEPSNQAPSNWNAGNPQYPQPGMNPTTEDVVEQKTVLHTAVNGPITDPVANPRRLQSLKPSQSGLAPMASLHGIPPVQQPSPQTPAPFTPWQGVAQQPSVPSGAPNMPRPPKFHSQPLAALQPPPARPMGFPNGISYPGMSAPNPVSYPGMPAPNGFPNGISYPGMPAPNPNGFPNGISYPGMPAPNPNGFPNGISYPGMPAPNPVSYPGMPVGPGMNNATIAPNPTGFPSGAGYPGMPANPAYPGAPANFNRAGMMGGPPPMMQPPNNMPPGGKKRQQRQFPIWARALVVILILFVVAGGSVYAYYQANYGQSIGHITGQQAYHHNQGNGQASTTGNNSTLTGGRINILLLGSDDDGKNGNDIATGTPLAQTDIIVTIDPQSHYVAMVSIPRDMQVRIPGYSNGDKLDKAFMSGVSGNNIPHRVGSGAGQAEDTITQNFGININYYAWVDIYGFAKVVDTAGGVDIDATHPMVDDIYPDDANKQGDAYGYKRLYIAPGPQHMDGTQALEYVRTRHSDLVGDFGRSTRQQQLLSALKQKLASPDIVQKGPQLLKDLDGSLFTDMTPDQIVQIANYARGVDLNKLDRITLGPPTYAHSPQNSANTNVLPNCPAIRAKISQVFGLGDQAKCIPQYASNGSSIPGGIASTTQPANNAASATVSTQTTNNAMSNMAMSLNHSYNEFDSIHSLLDLMLMVVFESFSAAQA